MIGLTMREKIKKVLRKVADCLNEHWIWKTIILFLPSVYMPVLIKYGGEELKLSNKNGGLTKAGIIITALIYLSVLGINILSNYKAKKDRESDSIKNKKNAINKLENIKKSISEKKVQSIEQLNLDIKNRESEIRKINFQLEKKNAEKDGYIFPWKRYRIKPKIVI